MTGRVSIQTEDFDAGQVLLLLRASDKRVGAVCSFIGTVRDRNMAVLPDASHHLPSPDEVVLPNGGPSVKDVVLSMELEHYPGMTEKAIEAMVDDAVARFGVYGVRVIHRVGVLLPLDQVVMVAVTSAHRGTSFQACEFLIDFLKTQAPFWKKEQTPEGARWVDARVADDAALAKWGIRATNT